MGRELLLAFYGDDMTGSTDAMEALMRSGVRTRVFLTVPTLNDLAAAPEIEAVGFAGESRAMSPSWMSEHLPPVFAALGALGAPLLHYKCCSTFDSSPTTGSIGRVLEIGLGMFGGTVPIVLGVPELGRWTAFGQLYAKDKSGVVHRIDRHPVMAVHPKTPMHEADLLVHLGRQTDSSSALIDFRTLHAGDGLAAYRAYAAEGIGAVLLDNLDEITGLAIGRLLLELAIEGGPVFAIGSSGVEYALLSALHADGAGRPPLDLPAVEEVATILVLSGSGSLTTAAQIADARRLGYEVIPARSADLADEATNEVHRLAAVAVVALTQGRSVIVTTVEGPDDPRLSETTAALASKDRDSGQALGTALGHIALAVLANVPALKRVVFAGGDTSSFGARAMGIDWLDMRTTIVPGSPLCRAGSSNPQVDGLDVLFKGGQIGAANYFEAVRQGRPPRDPLAIQPN